MDISYALKYNVWPFQFIIILTSKEMQEQRFSEQYDFSIFQH